MMALRGAEQSGAGDQKQRRCCDRIPNETDGVVKGSVENGHLVRYQRHRACCAVELDWLSALDCVPAMARIASRVARTWLARI